MSDTPRTDAENNRIDFYSGHNEYPPRLVSVDFARELERENVVLRAELDAALARVDKAVRVCTHDWSGEMTALRVENAVLRSKDNHWRESNSKLIAENAALREDAAALCDIIDHADPAAWRNGNTPPDYANGPDEGEVMMSEMYYPLRAKHHRAALAKEPTP